MSMKWPVEFYTYQNEPFFYQGHLLTIPFKMIPPFLCKCQDILHQDQRQVRASGATSEPSSQSSGSA